MTEINRVAATPAQLAAETAARQAADALLIPLAQRAAANGVATLGADSKLTAGQLPALAITDTFVAASQVAMLALAAHTGDVCVRTDLSESFILAGSDPTVLSNWVHLLSPPDAVTSVAGKVGTVVLVEGDVTGLVADLAARVVVGGDIGGTPAAPTVVGLHLAGDTAVGHKLTSVTDPTGAQDAATKNYVDNVAAGINPAVAVQAATTLASDTSGLASVAGTLVGALNTALTVDGYTFTALGQRLLVKDDTVAPAGARNGVYYVTQLQALGLPVVLTRALDYDVPADINNTGAIPVVNGTTNALTSWLLTSQVTVVGTDPLTYAKFSYAPTKAPGYELGYVERTTNFTTVTTTEATADQIVSLGAITFDGGPVMFQFFAPYWAASVATKSPTIVLYEDGVSIGRFFTSDIGTNAVPCLAWGRYTPSAGSHTYSFRAYIGGGGTLTIGAGARGTGAFWPAYARAIKV